MTAAWPRADALFPNSIQFYGHRATAHRWKDERRLKGRLFSSRPSRLLALPYRAAPALYKDRCRAR
jgi:hypothetical protein